MPELKYIGNEETLVRSEYGGAKQAVKKGDTFSATEEMAKVYLEGAYKKSFELVEKKIAKAVVKKEAVAKGKTSKK